MLVFLLNIFAETLHHKYVGYPKILNMPCPYSIFNTKEPEIRFLQHPFAISL